MAIIVSSSARSTLFILSSITNHVYRRQVVSALKTTAAAARRHTAFAMLLAFVTLLLVLATRPAQCHQQSYDVVRNFHAAADGKTDDAKAFLAAWKAACSDEARPVVVVPGGRTFLLSQVTFQGPCKSPITIQLDGRIVAPNRIWTTQPANLLVFHGVDSLTLDGNGEIDGRGAIWWDCYNHKRCNARPILLAFSFCDHLRVTRIRLTNSADKHMTLFRCSQALVDGVSIAAPPDSPNTDGITVASSNHTVISNCSIRSGDDCVSILSQTRNVTVTRSTCGPGHGISVGSLGRSESAVVEQIVVTNCSFVGTMNGVRIKSWQGGKGYAKGFLFAGLNMTGVQYPIVIDQFYCPQGNCPVKPGGVAITDARFIDIQGTSSRQEAIRLLCSQSVHCHGIYLSNVNLSWVNHTAPSNATILNAHGTTEGVVVPKIQFLQPL
ncbi:Pectin lyase-like superfamily protein [Zea mays]|uniref:Pectin lyase-like superfamily protein n=2 Tax=Zea mays TaxID=4577 RepID=A0A1D6MK53_MAIZE|nr:Pectin lyase-like superfamily protein [Zea mays]